MDEKEAIHLEALYMNHVRRLRILELQASSFGLHVPPHVVLEMENIREQIALIRQQLATVEKAASKMSDGEYKAVANPVQPKHELGTTVSVLFLAADPTTASRLRIGEELREIQQQLHLATRREQFKLEQRMSVRSVDVSQALLDVQPQIVHFSGHGTSAGAICFENQVGEIQVVTPDALSELFRQFSDYVNCVVLNACYSEVQAKAIAEHIDYVIGMNGAIGDKAAIAFAIGFYQALGAGRTIEESFALGTVQIQLQGIPEHLTPTLVRRNQLPADSAEDEASGAIAQSALEENVLGFTEDNRRDLREKPEAALDLPALYEVWFGTNRALTDATDANKGFSNERDPDGTVHYGTCSVYIPQTHKFGSAGSPFWKRLIRLEFTDDHLSLRGVKAIDSEGSFLNALRNDLESKEETDREVVVFLHGYNTSFEEAALRAAQIGFDLKVAGAMAFYSWPSKANELLYLDDRENVEASEMQIADFLVAVSTRANAKKVHVIAHSMGNRGFARAVSRITSYAAATSSVHFGQIILAAADLDIDLFKQLAVIYPKISDRTTMYVSAKDKPLLMSRFLQDSDRAGFTPPVTVVEGIDTVEVTNVDLTLLGHGYFSAAEAVLYDMWDLITKNTPPAHRARTKSRTNQTGQRYWEISA